VIEASCADVRQVETLGPSFWRERLAPYAEPRVSRGVLDLATSVVPYLALTAAAYALLPVSYLFALVFAVPAAGFLLRTFIVFHDCTHGSFLPSRTANKWVGIVCGLIVMTPFHIWRHEHAVHHATAGDLDHRGKGDVETLTVAESLIPLPWLMVVSPPDLEVVTRAVSPCEVVVTPFLVTVVPPALPWVMWIAPPAVSPEIVAKLKLGLLLPKSVWVMVMLPGTVEAVTLAESFTVAVGGEASPTLPLP